MSETALVRHMIAKVTMDTAGYSRGADRVKRESKALGSDFKRTFGRGVEGIEVLGRALRGGAIFGGMTALAFKAVEVKKNYDQLGETFKQFPGILSDFGRAELSVLQSLPMIGGAFDIGKEASASIAELDNFLSRSAAVKQVRGALDKMRLSGNAKEVAELTSQFEGLIDKLNEMRRAADRAGDSGLKGLIDTEIKRAKEMMPRMILLQEFKPITDAIKQVMEATEKVGRTEREVAMRRFTELRASKQAVKELGRAYDELERRQFAEWGKEMLREKARRQAAKDLTLRAEARQLNLASDPRARLEEEIKDLMGLFNRGLSAKGFAARVSQLKDSLGLSSSSSLPEFAQKGTQAAFSAVNQKKDDKTAEIAKLEKEALKYMQNQQYPLLLKIQESLGSPAEVN